MEVFVVSYARSGQGAFLGALKDIPGTDLCGTVMSAAIEKAGISPEDIDEVFVGNVISAGVGQNPAKQCALKAGIPVTTPCTMVNKVCCSSLKAVTLATQILKLGDAQCCLVGGFESMSKAPHILPNSRQGIKFGDFSAKDSMIVDGLWDASNNKHMGELTDILAEEMGVTREEQDRFTLQSFARAKAAWDEGAFNETVVPIKTRAGEFKEDESIGKLMADKIPRLRPAFRPTGTITAANASSLADGASAMIVASRSFVESHSLKPIAKILFYADGGAEPSRFPLAPIEATKKLLSRSGVNAEDVDLWEVNEAFACVPLLFMKEFGIPEEKMNVLGGAVAIGHPLGCTGCRILGTLIDALKHKGLKLGVATLCNGGGGGTAIMVEMI